MYFERGIREGASYLYFYINMFFKFKFCTGTVTANVHCYNIPSNLQSAYIILTYNVLRGAEYDKVTKSTLYKIKP